MSELVFGKYQIIRRLAVGGMGEIFLARQTGVFERLVILKSLLPSIAEQPGAVEMFLDEARVAATLAHPNVIAIYEVGRWEGQHFIAMEYIDGENLLVLRKAAQELGTEFPMSMACKILYDAALALDYAHQAKDSEGKPLGVVHRDISPHNIMVTVEGVTKVVDFGIAVAANRLSDRTATGVIKGKVAYMAPEQVMAERVDARADQYALGAILWELLTGTQLVKGRSNEVSTLVSVLEMKIDPPSSVNPNIPPELDAITLRMLAKDKEARFPTCGDAARELEGWLRVHGPVGIAPIGEMVRLLVGEKLQARTRELKTAGEDFLIRFAISGAESRENLPKVEERSDSTRPRPDPASTNQRPTEHGAYPVVGDSTNPELGFAGASSALVGPTRSRGLRIGGAAAALLVAVAAVVMLRGASSTPEAQPISVEIEIPEPVGASFTVDGVPHPERPPTIVRGLAPGAHEIVFDVDGRKLRRSVEASTEARAVANAALEPVPPSLRLDSIPPGAEVVLGSKMLAKTPAQLNDLKPDEDLSFVLKLPGHEDQRITLKLLPGEKRDMVVPLRAAAVAAQVSATKARPVQAPVERPAERPVEKPTEAQAPIVIVTPPPSAVEDGFVTINAKPWAKLEIDGKAIGVTPVFKHRLAPGTHVIRFVNDELGVDQKKEVRVEPGATEKLNVDLAKAP